MKFLNCKLLVVELLVSLGFTLYIQNNITIDCKKKLFILTIYNSCLNQLLFIGLIFLAIKQGSAFGEKILCQTYNLYNFV